MLSEKVIYESKLMSGKQVSNPFEIAAVPKWFWVIGIAMGLLVCWLLFGQGDEPVLGLQRDKPLHMFLCCMHALVLAVFLTLCYQLILVLMSGRSLGTEDRYHLLCDHFLPEYADVANPEQVEDCSHRLLEEATAAHNRRFVLMTTVALPVSVIAYLGFLFGLRGSSLDVIEKSNLFANLLVTLVECVLLVMFIGITSLLAKQRNAAYATQLTKMIAAKYRSGDLARRAKPAAAPPMHDLTPPEIDLMLVSEDMPSEQAVFPAGDDDDLPPTVLGNDAGSPKKDRETGNRSRRRRGGV